MAAIFAGVMLWLFVVLAFLVHIDLGSAAIVALLSLGAVLIAISFIETIKVSASGFELKTREQGGVVKTNINIPHLPRLNYFKTICWMFMVLPLAIVIVLWFLQWSKEGYNLTMLLVWSVILATVAALTLFFSRLPPRRKGQEALKPKEDSTQAPK
jgi:hypothetical protein